MFSGLKYFFLSFRLGTSGLLQNKSYLHVCTMFKFRAVAEEYVYNCHTFNWTKTQLLGRAQTKYAREFIEAWHSTDDVTIYRHIYIPTVYLQLKTVRKNSVNNDTKITNTNVVSFPITLQYTSKTQWRRQVSEFGRAFEGQHAFWGGKIEFHEISPPPRCQNF